MHVYANLKLYDKCSKFKPSFVMPYFLFKTSNQLQNNILNLIIAIAWSTRIVNYLLEVDVVVDPENE